MHPVRESSLVLSVAGPGADGPETRDVRGIGSRKGVEFALDAGFAARPALFAKPLPPSSRQILGKRKWPKPTWVCSSLARSFSVNLGRIYFNFMGERRNLSALDVTRR